MLTSISLCPSKPNPPPLIQLTNSSSPRPDDLSSKLTNFHHTTTMVTRKKPSILILGDLILNQDFHGKASHLSRDAPIPVLAQTKITSTVGGAANIAKNLAALEAKVTLIGIIGQDTEGQKIRSILHDCGVYNIAFVYDGRPTTSKTRIHG